MKMKTFLVTVSLAALAAGCQMGRPRTPGERIVMNAAETPATREIAPPAATAPLPTAPSTAAIPAATAPAPVVYAPATAPTSTAPVPRGARLYVAADADDAARLRNWPLSVNQYANGNVIAGPTYRIIAPPPRSDRWDDQYAVNFFQTALSIPQMIGTPIWMLVAPPWTPVEYHGEQFPPSYTVDDPLPYYENEKVPGMIQMKRDK